MAMGPVFAELVEKAFKCRAKRGVKVASIHPGNGRNSGRFHGHRPLFFRYLLMQEDSARTNILNMIKYH